MKAKERLYVTADRQTAVRAGDKQAVYLLAAKGQEVPDVIVKLYGLVEGRVKGMVKGRVKKKQRQKPSNKMVGGVANKSGG